MGSKNRFKLSEDGLYWIGYTQKGEEFWFVAKDKSNFW